NLNAVATDINRQLSPGQNAGNLGGIDAGHTGTGLQSRNHGTVQGGHTIDDLGHQGAHGVGGIQVGANDKGLLGAVDRLSSAQGNDVGRSGEEDGIPIHAVIPTDSSLLDSS